MSGTKIGTDPAQQIAQLTMQTAGKLAPLFPKQSALGRYLSDLSKNPLGIFAFAKLLKGRTFTKGDYGLGEEFARNIIGDDRFQSWKDVPDDLVPLSWGFFTAALGVMARTSDNLHALADSPSAYINWGPEYNSQPVANVERASRILKKIGYNTNYASIRNVIWDPSWFVSEPYVYPLPGIEPGSLFTGVHPILGVEFKDGYPVDQSSPATEGLPTNSSQSSGNSQEKSDSKLWLVGLALLAGIAWYESN